MVIKNRFLTKSSRYLIIAIVLDQDQTPRTKKFQAYNGYEHNTLEYVDHPVVSDNANASKITITIIVTVTITITITVIVTVIVDLCPLGNKVISRDIIQIDMALPNMEATNMRAKSTINQHPKML